MASANITMGVKGIDKTGAAFNSIKNRAKATGAQIRSIMGGALAAAGAYLSIRAIAGAVNELGTLSDIAQKANISVTQLAQSTKALNVLGVGVTTETFAKAMQMLEKNTGRTGMRGFYDTIGEIGKIPDTAERAQAAVKVFGRSGLEFMPLINKAKDGTKALEELTAAFPGVSQAAADAGDDIADGAGIVSAQFKTWWLEAIGAVAQSISGAMPNSFRQSMALLMAYADYYVKSIGDIFSAMWIRLTRGFGFFQAYSNAVGAAIGGTIDLIFGSGGKLQRGILSLEEFLEKFWIRATRGFGYFVSAANAAGAAIGATFEKLFGSGGTWGDVGAEIARAWKSGPEEYSQLISEVEQKYAEKRKGVGNGSWSDLGAEIGKAWNAGWQEYEDDLEEIEDRMDARAAAFGKRFNAAENFESNYRNAAGSNASAAAESFGAAAAKHISNKLILAGSNESRLLQFMGPQVNEAKKQTSLLEKIAKNTEKTAENTEDGGEPLAATDLS